MKTRTFFSMCIVLILCTLLTAPALAFAPGAALPEDSPPVHVPEAVLLLIPVLVGSIGIPVINWLKLQFGWTKPEDKPKNLWLSFGVSMALAIIALLITGSFVPLTGPNTFVAWISLAFTVATLIYKSMQPPAEPTPS